MFTVLQRFDFSGQPLHEVIVRTVYAVDRPTKSFLVKGCFGKEFIWIPMSSCEPYDG
jgi:hypothetical protein